MSDSNVVDFSKYQKDWNGVPDDVPESFLLVNDIGTFLFDERDLLVKKVGPTLFIKSGEKEYALTIRELDSHYENLEVWKQHVALKYQEYLNVAQPDDAIDLTVEEIMILSPEGFEEGLNQSETKGD